MKKSNYQIAVDVMGGDKGAAPFVLAAREFALNNSNCNLYLVGDQTEINAILNKPELYENIKVVHAPDVITNEDPLLAFRNKTTSTLTVGLKLVANNECQAMVSPGPTANLYAAALFILKTLPKIDRPAFMGKISASFGNKKPFCFYDAGANLSLSSSQLAALTKIAYQYWKFSFQQDSSTKVKIAFLCSSLIYHNAQVNYDEVIKLLEVDDTFDKEMVLVKPTEVFTCNADLIASDGWVGNLFIKTLEGASSTYMNNLKNLFESVGNNENIAAEWKEFLLILKSKQNNFNKFDYQTLGGGFFLGLSAPFFKLHGAANSTSLLSCLQECKNILEIDLMSNLRARLI